METVHFTSCCFLNTMKCDLNMAEKVNITTTSQITRLEKKSKIFEGWHLQIIILSGRIKNSVLWWKAILLLKCHSLNHKFDDICWNIKHRHNFFPDLSYKTRDWVCIFRGFFFLSIKIHLQSCSKQIYDICRHT